MYFLHLNEQRLKILPPMFQSDMIGFNQFRAFAEGQNALRQEMTSETGSRCNR